MLALITFYCTVTIVLSAQPRPADSYIDERPLQPQPLVLKGVKRDVKLLLPPQAFEFNIPGKTLKKKREDTEIRKLDTKRILKPKKFTRSTGVKDGDDPEKTVNAKAELYRNAKLENPFLKHNTFIDKDNVQYFEISKQDTDKPNSEVINNNNNNNNVKQPITSRGSKKFKQDPVILTLNEPIITNQYEEFTPKPIIETPKTQDVFIIKLEDETTNVNDEDEKNVKIVVEDVTQTPINHEVKINNFEDKDNFEHPITPNYFKELQDANDQNENQQGSKDELNISERPKNIDYYEENAKIIDKKFSELPKNLDYYEEVAANVKQPKKTSYFDDEVNNKQINKPETNVKNYYDENKQLKNVNYYNDEPVKKTNADNKHTNYYDENNKYRPEKQLKELKNTNYFNYEPDLKFKKYHHDENKPLKNTNYFNDEPQIHHDEENKQSNDYYYDNERKHKNDESETKKDVGREKFRIYEDYDESHKDLENQPIIVHEVAAEPEEYGDEAETKNYAGYKGEEVKKEEIKDYDENKQSNVDYDYVNKPKIFSEQKDDDELYNNEKIKGSNSLYPQPVKADYKVHEEAEKKAKAGGAAKAGGGGHKKVEPKHVEHEKGGGKKHESEHKQVHKEAGEKEYQGKHVNAKHETGHHGKEEHKEHYKDVGGSQKKHQHSDGYHGEHDKADKGEKGAKYDEEGKHEKGHSTHGTHNIHKKDEFEKKEEFYDEYHEGGDFDKSGGFFDEEDYEKGGHYKKGHADGGAHHDHYAKKDGHEHGDYYKDGKGHKGDAGHDVHHGHVEDHHVKLTKSGHKKWGYHNEQDDGGKKAR